MIRASAAIVAVSFLVPVTPSHAKGGPRTLSDYNIQKEYLMPAPSARRYFNGPTSTFAAGARGTWRGFTHGEKRRPAGARR